MPFDALPVGLDISKHPAIQAADIICIHWTSGDYMSPKTIEKLLKLEKPTYQFCHDNNPFTGGCHVRMGCEGYKTGCGNCPQLSSAEDNDLSKMLIKEKEKLASYDNYIFVSPSTWMDQNVASSFLYKNKKHYVLPNVIDTKEFKPCDKGLARKQYEIAEDNVVLLVGLKANTKIPYNGTEYLEEILKKFYEKTNGIWQEKPITIAFFGTKEVNIDAGFPNTRNLGFINGTEELSKVYSLADMYLVTSLEDSFNQTVAECMACETPVVAFDNGGIADIIDHKENGYLSKYKDVEDYLMGIEYVLHNVGAMQPREKIEKTFSERKVMGLYKIS